MKRFKAKSKSKTEKNELFIQPGILADIRNKTLYISTEVANNLTQLNNWQVKMYCEYKSKYPDFKEQVVEMAPVPL